MADSCANYAKNLYTMGKNVKTVRKSYVGFALKAWLVIRIYRVRRTVQGVIRYSYLIRED